MNYRTKIPIPSTDFIIPVGSKLNNAGGGDYFLKFSGINFVFGRSIVESNPDIFEPERSWSDEEMIEFRYDYLCKSGITATQTIDILNEFAKLKGK